MKIETRYGKPYMSSCGKVMPRKQQTSLQLDNVRKLIEQHKKSLDILEEFERKILARNGK